MTVEQLSLVDECFVTQPLDSLVFFLLCISEFFFLDEMTHEW